MAKRTVKRIEYRVYWSKRGEDDWQWYSSVASRGGAIDDVRMWREHPVDAKMVKVTVYAKADPLAATRRDLVELIAGLRGAA